MAILKSCMHTCATVLNYFGIQLIHTYNIYITILTDKTLKFILTFFTMWIYSTPRLVTHTGAYNNRVRGICHLIS